MSHSHRTDRLQRVADLERIVDVLAVEVDAADAVDPEQLLADDFLEDVVELVVLGEPAVAADIELEFAVLGFMPDRTRQAADERRLLDHGRRNAGLAQHICRAETTRTRSHDKRGAVGRIRSGAVGMCGHAANAFLNRRYTKRDECPILDGSERDLYRSSPWCSRDATRKIATILYTTGLLHRANATVGGCLTGAARPVTYSRQVIALFRLKFQTAATPAPIRLATR